MKSKKKSAQRIVTLRITPAQLETICEHLAGPINSELFPDADGDTITAWRAQRRNVSGRRRA